MKMTRNTLNAGIREVFHHPNMHRPRSTFNRIALAFAAIAAYTSPSDASALADLAEAKNWTQIESVLAETVSVDEPQPDGTTALHWAVHHGHAPTVRLLLDKNADANAVTRYDIHVLSIACAANNDEIVKLLLAAGAKPNTALPGGETPMMTAARTGNAKSIAHLIQHGATLDATERNGQTALMWAAAKGHINAVESLINAGADLNATTKSGFTAMMFAAREGRTDVIQRFLESGIDVNSVIEPRKSGKRAPRKGTSALLMAVESGHFELAMFLIANGADPNDQRSGLSPLHAITSVRKPNRGEEPDGDPPPRGSGNMTSLDFVRAIVDAGADVNLQLETGKGGKAFLNRKGATPMLLAAKTADLALIELLVELGADPKRTNVDGCTTLMAAAGVGVRAVGEEAGTEPEVMATVQYFLDHGLDVNTVDDNQETAMHGAAYRCYPKVVELLARNGADSKIWNRKNASGWTPVLIGQGHRPGSFKPSPETVAALQRAMQVGTN